MIKKQLKPFLASRAKIVTKIKSRANWDGKEKNISDISEAGNLRAF